MSKHENASDKPREVGLRAIHEARTSRTRSSKLSQITPRAWLVLLSAVFTAITVAWFVRERSLTNDKNELLAKHRAAVATVGAEWFPLRDTIEQRVLAASGPYEGDYVDPEIASWDFRSRPGIYLRLRAEYARDVEVLRDKAMDSVRDSFAACLLRPENESTAAMARGEPDAGASFQDQPWNLRLAYHSTRLLTDEWAAEASDAIDEISLRLFVHQYEKAIEQEIPLAIDIIKRAEFFLFVLDEDAPEAAQLAREEDAGAVTQEHLQQVLHPARVHLVDLKTGREVLRLRREVDAHFRFAGERAVRSGEVLAAMKRQVNNCALAQSVWEAIEARAPGAADADADAAP